MQTDNPYDMVHAMSSQTVELQNLLARANELISTRLIGATNEDDWSWAEWRGLAEEWQRDYQDNVDGEH